MQIKVLFSILAILIFASCKMPEARRPIKNSSGTVIDQSVARNKELYAKEIKLIEKLIAKDSTNDYIASNSGFWYYYNVKDDDYGDKPEFGDVVSFTYNIEKLDGTSIISEEENGLQTLKVDQTNQELISGIRDGLKLMKDGEVVTFLFPSYKAFGYYGIQEKLGANVPVRSKVTLKSID